MSLSSGSRRLPENPTEGSQPPAPRLRRSSAANAAVFSFFVSDAGLPKDITFYGCLRRGVMIATAPVLPATMGQVREQSVQTPLNKPAIFSYLGVLPVSRFRA